MRVTYEERETPHRVIIGKEYYEDFQLQPEQVLDRAFAYLLAKKVQRQTEGEAVSLIVLAAVNLICDNDAMQPPSHSFPAVLGELLYYLSTRDTTPCNPSLPFPRLRLLLWSLQEGSCVVCEESACCRAHDEWGVPHQLLQHLHHRTVL